MSVTLLKGETSSLEAPGGPARKGRDFPKLALAAPLILVNAAAIWGQAGWAHENFAGGSWILAIAFAAALESIGVYLALEAHAALMADQASGLLRAGSYAIGALAALLNYWHFADSPAQAIAFAAMSAISPWLWAIRSRSANRSRLAEMGLVDPRGVKLSTTRKLWHPVKSLKVIRWASWEGETNPEAAVRGWELRKQLADVPAVEETPAPQPEPDPIDPRPTRRKTKDDYRAEALAIWSDQPTLTQIEVAARLGISDRHLRTCMGEAKAA